MQTGDLILFHGLLPSSKLTEFLQNSKWSHVGMVINPKDIDVEYDGLLLWESNTITNLEDIILNKAKTGPMIVDLKKRIQTDKNKNYDSPFQIRYLTTDNKNKLDYSKLRNFIKIVHHCDYSSSEDMMLQDMIAGIMENKNLETDRYFCSKLIAETYINLGFLTTNYVSNSYMPKDFSSEENLPFLNRIHLYNGPYFEVK